MRGPLRRHTVGLFLSGGAYAHLKQVFDKVAVGADSISSTNPRETPFGSYGHLADRYGVRWFFRGETSTSSCE